jgi:hypothetical protein
LLPLLLLLLLHRLRGSIKQPCAPIQLTSVARDSYAALCCCCCCLQDFLSSQAKAKKSKAAARVDAILFAAANVGDGKFVAGFNQMVNARR